MWLLLFIETCYRGFSVKQLNLQKCSQQQRDVVNTSVVSDAVINTAGTYPLMNHAMQGYIQLPAAQKASLHFKKNPGQKCNNSIHSHTTFI